MEATCIAPANDFPDSSIAVSSHLYVKLFVQEAMSNDGFHKRANWLGLRGSGELGDMHRRVPKMSWHSKLNLLEAFDGARGTGSSQALTLSHPLLETEQSSFIPRTCNLWNVLPSSCFPESYNLPSFKSKINKLDLISLSS